MSKRKRQLSENLEKQAKLVLHRKTKKLGIVLERSELQSDFYYVMSEGSLEEWHISNIDEHH